MEAASGHDNVMLWQDPYATQNMHMILMLQLIIARLVIKATKINTC